MRPASVERQEKYGLAMQMMMHTRAAARTKPQQGWRTGAACAGRALTMDVERWSGLPADRILDDERPALRICHECPVIRQCNRWVLSLTTNDDPGGVCGGMTEGQRKSARHGRTGVPDG